MKRLCWVLFCFLSYTAVLPAQGNDNVGAYYWRQLSKVSYKLTLDKADGELLNKPVFDKSVKSLEGKEIVLSGYIIPADMGNGTLTLSAYPFSSCFFCGGAGPETVVEVEAQEPLIFNINKPIVLKGKLQLNEDDPLRMFYTLKEATYYEED